MEWERHDQEEYLRFEKDLEEPTPMNDRSNITIPKPYNPYQSPYRLPLPSDEEMQKRAHIYWKQMEAERKRGWRRAHPKPYLLVPAVFFFFLAACVLALGWW